MIPKHPNNSAQIERTKEYIKCIGVPFQSEVEITPRPSLLPLISSMLLWLPINTNKLIISTNRHASCFRVTTVWQMTTEGKTSILCLDSMVEWLQHILPLQQLYLWLSSQLKHLSRAQELWWSIKALSLVNKKWKKQASVQQKIPYKLQYYGVGYIWDRHPAKFSFLKKQALEKLKNPNPTVSPKKKLKKERTPDELYSET